MHSFYVLESPLKTCRHKVFIILLEKTVKLDVGRNTKYEVENAITCASREDASLYINYKEK